MTAVGRRNLIHAAGLGACAVCLPGCSQGGARSAVEDPAGSPPEAISPSPAPSASPVAAAGDVRSVPIAVTDRVSGDPAFLFKTSGEMTLLSAVCTHAGCIVEWSAAAGQFICPCHRSTFDTDGSVLSGPAPSPLPKLAVTVRNGQVYRDS